MGGLAQLTLLRSMSPRGCLRSGREIGHVDGDVTMTVGARRHQLCLRFFEVAGRGITGIPETRGTAGETALPIAYLVVRAKR